MAYHTKVNAFERQNLSTQYYEDLAKLLSRARLPVGYIEVGKDELLHHTDVRHSRVQIVDVVEVNLAENNISFKWVSL